MFNPTAAQYAAASVFLYKELSGDPTGNRVPTGKSYFSFKPNMLLPKDQAQAVIAIADPFGYSYGYSTAYQANPSKGYNPTFDLWSTAGTGTGSTPTNHQRRLRRTNGSRIGEPRKGRNAFSVDNSPAF